MSRAVRLKKMQTIAKEYWKMAALCFQRDVILEM